MCFHKLWASPGPPQPYELGYVHSFSHRWPAITMRVGCDFLVSSALPKPSELGVFVLYFLPPWPATAIRVGCAFFNFPAPRPPRPCELKQAPKFSAPWPAATMRVGCACCLFCLLLLFYFLAGVAAFSLSCLRVFCVSFWRAGVSFLLAVIRSFLVLSCFRSFFLSFLFAVLSFFL